MDWAGIFERMIGTVPALFGACIGGYFTLRATRAAAKREADRERRTDEKEVQNMLDAIGVEINALWSFHMRRVGHVIEDLKPGQPFEISYPLTQDYFTIYHSNAGNIGRVKDAALREAVVVTYNKCKKVVDGFKYNNDLIREGKKDIMVAYAQLMKEDHFELKGYIENLLNLLEHRH